MGCLWNSVLFNLARAGVYEPKFLSRSGRVLSSPLQQKSA